MKRKLNLFINEHPYLFGAIMVTLLTLLVYGDVIFGPANIVLSHQGTDLSTGIFNLQFTFSQFRHGNFPLWNPHLLSGYPWFASFQTLMLYPPAWLFLILPVGKSVNVFVALHIFVMGFGMFCWLKQRDLHPLSCILGAALLMFGSTVTIQIYAGHITPLAAMAWVPFIFLAVDGCFDRTYRLRWILAGTLCIALQIMAGFPQHVYYTALLVGIYVIGKIILLTSATMWERLKVLLSVFAIYFWGCSICAIQLLATFAAASETARHGKLPFDFAGSFSFPPINFLTLAAPKILGDNAFLPYWGHWYLWEMVLFIGITGAILSLYGMWISSVKERLLFGVIIILTCLVALGFYTPFYSALYHHVPGFGSFRANSRILFELTLFLTALAAKGYDCLLKNPKSNLRNFVATRFSFALAAGLGIFTCVAFWQSSWGKGLWVKVLLRYFYRSHQQYLSPQFYSDPSSAHAVASFATTQLALATITTIIIILLLRDSLKSARSIYYLGTLAIAEVLFFTITMRPTFNLNSTKLPYNAFLKSHPGDSRFLKFPLNNWANSLPLSISGGDISGYESFRLLRYDEFVQYAENKNENAILPTLGFDKTSPLFALLRCEYLFQDGKVTKLAAAPLPHLLIIPKWQIEPRKEKVLSGLRSPSFNPRSTVYLESAPRFNSSQGAIPKSNKAVITNQSTDWMDIKATVRHNSVLLVTDSYSKDWKIFPYADSSQQKYDVMPANYVLRGIPLSPGIHHFRLQYAPNAFYRGKNISLIALTLYALAWCGLLGINRRKNETDEKDTK